MMVLAKMGRSEIRVLTCSTWLTVQSRHGDSSLVVELVGGLMHALSSQLHGYIVDHIYEMIKLSLAMNFKCHYGHMVARSRDFWKICVYEKYK